MLQKIELQNFGPLPALEWNDLQKINLVIGKSSSGKAFLLKALYSAIRTLEEYQRGNDQRTASEILADKCIGRFSPTRSATW